MKSLLSLFLLTSTLSKCNAYLSNTIIKSKLGFKSMPSSNYMTNTILRAAPKRGSIVDSYRSVDCSCSKCKNLLFKYKKKNGTKSNLVKMYVERIYEDYHGIIPYEEINNNDNNINISDSNKHKNSNKDGNKEKEELMRVPLTSEMCICPNCNLQFGRPATIKGREAIKIIGNRIRMS